MVSSPLIWVAVDGFLHSADDNADIRLRDVVVKAVAEWNELEKLYYSGQDSGLSPG